MGTLHEVRRVVSDWLSSPRDRAGGPGGTVASRAPIAHRLMLRAYPARFREEFGGDVLRHLARQRVEPRYRRSALGRARFWWDAGVDALATGARLRRERLRERWARLWGGGPDGKIGAGSPGGRGPRDGWLGPMADALGRDLRDALRGVARNPGYAAVFIATLGLGIGANTAMFSAVNGVLLRPLPHDDGDRLVYLRHSAPLAGIANATFSVPEIDDYRQGAPSLGAVAEFSAMNFTMLGWDTPRRVRAGIVTGNYFEVMGLSAVLGRAIGPEDDGPDAPAVIVASHRYWRSVLGGDPDIVGKTVELTGVLQGRVATFVGVAEPAPPYPERTDVWVNMATSPHHLGATMNEDRIHRMTEVFARLAPGATVESTRAEVDAISERIHAEYPDAYDAGAGFQVTVTPLKTQLTSRARPTLLVLLATAFLVLVIACANLGNLTLARVLRRGHELAIRVSLGGSRAALRRSLLVESLLLALVGAGLGLVIASVGLDLLVAFASRFTSRAPEIGFDGSVFAFALLAAVGASLFFSMLPPLPGGDRWSGALSGSRSTAAPGARGAQRVLVVAQVATTFVLLIGAGLLLRTLLHLNAVDPGFDRAQVLTMDIPANAAGRSAADVRTQFLGVLEDVRALPGVEGAALTSAVPLARKSGLSTQMEIDVEDHEPAPGAPGPRADFRVVSGGYFAAMGIEVLRGREFVATDVEDAQKVVVINESMAKAYFGEGDAVGRRLAWTDDVMKFLGMDREWRTVVGVVADTRDDGLDADVVHAVYNPYRQVTPAFTGSLVVRVAREPEAVLPAVRGAILARDPNQAIVDVATIAELGEQSVAPLRLNALLLGAFAALALAIAAVGIGGVLAFSVGSRRREFGVRSALGAAPARVWSVVLAEGARLAVIGVSVGTLTAVILTRFLSGFLVGVPALDPITFMAVALLLTSVAVVASWVPAWRAASVSPMEALAAE